MVQFIDSDLLLTQTPVPAARAIETEWTTINIDSPNPYRGNPTKELDDAWDELLHG
jgi:hypothetical protein